MIEDKEAYIAKRNELLNNREEVLEAIEIAEGYKVSWKNTTQAVTPT